MFISFSKRFDLPVEEVFRFFRTPADWTRLYGMADKVRELPDGWTEVPLKGSPFPLVARNSVVDPLRLVRWEFRGFWKGEGEIEFSPSGTGVVLEGFERISVRPLGLLSPLIEKPFLERRFRAVWNVGWHRLHGMEANARSQAAAREVRAPLEAPAR